MSKGTAIKALSDSKTGAQTRKRVAKAIRKGRPTPVSPSPASRPKPSARVIAAKKSSGGGSRTFPNKPSARRVKSRKG